MGYVADRWHKSRPKPGEPECGEHKGMVASAAHGKGKRWQARYDDPNGREITSLHKTKAEAEKEIIKQESAKQTGSWIDPKAGRIIVERFSFDTWLPAQDLIGRSQREYRGVLNRYLVPEWGPREMRSIKPSEAGTWQALLTSKYELSGSTPNRVARYVRSIFKLAVIDRVIPVSPFDGIRAPKLEQAPVRPPDHAEVQLLIQHAYKDLWKVMFETDAQTGLRSGELRGMRLEKVDFLRRVYHVDEQLVYESGKGLYLDKLKTGAGKRILPLHQRTVDNLATYVAKNPPPTAGPWAGLIFTMPDATPIGESTIDWALKQTCRYAKTSARHLHELRHHYASVLIAGGENPRVVQERMGHKDVMTTMRVYAHLFANAEEKTRSVLDAVWGTPGETASQEESTQQGGRIPETRRSKGALTQVIG